MLRTRLLQWWLVLSLIVMPLSALANETDNTTTTTTTTVPDTTTTTIPGEVEEVETFDGPLEEETEEETTETTTTTTTIPEWEQSTDIELPEDELDSQGNEVENNIQIDDRHSNGNWSCCGMTDFHMNLHYQQHGSDSNDYTFTLPETTTVDEEELEIDIYEVGFRIGALNNDGTVTYTHTDETTQVNVLEGQSNSNVQTMFEDVVYNIYDTLETFIESFTITINDWSLLDDISFKYIQPTTTTTTLPPPPEPEPEPFIPPPPPEPEIFVVVLDDGTEAEYQQHEIDDGTVERDNERKKNYEIYGVELTDEQIARGDLEQYDIEIIDDEDMVEDGKELSDDVDIPDVNEDRYENEPKYKTEEERNIEKEIQEFNDTVLEVEEYLEELEEFELPEVIIENIPEDIVIIIEDKKDELDKQIQSNDTKSEKKISEENELLEQELFEGDSEDDRLVQVEETIQEIVNIPIIEEDASDEEIEEAIEIYVQELDTEEVIEVLEEVQEVGVQQLEQVSEEVQEVIQAVVEEAIEEIEELTEEQVEVVAEVLQIQTEDVEIIAEAVKEDEIVAEAVEEYVERAVANADVENYTLADVVTEVQFETFLENPIEILVDFEDISLTNIGDDMTTDQKEKAQEVVVPVILTRIATMAAFVFRKTI